MKKIIKWAGIVLLSLLLLALAGGFILIKKAEHLMARTYTVDPMEFDIPTDSASIARGAKLAVLCTDCHGKHYEGFAFFNDEKIGKVYAPNLTKGKGGATVNYKDIDWIRSIRHGVRPNGEGLLIMPSEDFYALSKSDIAALIAYMKSIPPVDHEPEQNHMSSFGKILLAMGAFGEVHHAAKLNHSKGPGGAPAEGITPEYGKYVVDFSGCRSCHGTELHGGKHPDPNSPPVPAISTKGNPGKWSADQFISVLKSGKTPEGKDLNKKFMPISAFAGLSDEQLRAVHTYLQTLR